MSPRGTVRGTMDVGSLLVAAREFPIPVDEVVLELRRVSDNTVAFSRTLTSAEWSTTTTQLRIEVTLDLQSTTEEFIFTAIVRGGGIEYYRATGNVIATAGGQATTNPIAPTYTGPGLGADQLIFPALTTLGNGQTATLSAVVMQGNTTLTGVPVSFTSSNPGLLTPVPLGLNQATVTTPLTGSGSVTITAQTPNGLTTSGTVSWAPTAVAIVLVSGDGQSVLVGTQAPAPLVVEVRDGQNNPVPGYPVDFAVTLGPSGTSVTPLSTTTDGQGRAQTVVTAGSAAGPITVEATASGLIGSPVIFSAIAVAAPGPPASVAANSPLSQTAGINTPVSSPPSVIVRDAANLPVPNATVTFAVQPGNGTITGATQTTDANGVATVGSWTMPQTTGSYTLTATVGTLPSVSFTGIAVLVDGCCIVTVISGDGQTGPAGAPLASPLVVEVLDIQGNPMPQVTVNWATPDGGSFSPASGPTDVNGRAQATWTLGPTAPSQTASALAGGTATFTATATFGPSPITLSFVGVPGVGVGLSTTVRATIPAAAPAGGVAVTLASDPPTGIVGVQAPATRTIPQGSTTVDFVVNGVAVGSTTLRVTATGFTDGTLPITVQNRNISVPATLNVPYGGTASLPIQLPDPAPAGGVTFTVQSSAPGNVSVATSPVTIAAGGQTANATLNGVLPGPATITVSNPAYIDGVTAASTTASLNIVQASATLNQSFGTSITINFESSGVPAAAPSPGITVDLTPTDPSCLAVTTPVTIPTGLVSTTATLTYGGSASLPCTTKLLAQATNLLADSINATVQVLPGITVGSVTVGSGLQDATSFNLGASNHGGVTVTVASSSPDVLVAPNATTAGQPSINFTLLNGTAFQSFYVHAVEGRVTDTVQATITVSATGFSNGTGTVNAIPPAIDLQGLPGTTTTLSPSSAVYVRAGTPNAANTALTQVQNVRFGGTPKVATFTTPSNGFGELLKAATAPGLTQTATIPANGTLYYTPTDTTSGGVAFHPLLAGGTTVSATIPDFISTTQAARSITVSQPGVTVGSLTVGSGLQDQTSFSLGASNHGGVTVTVASSSPDVLVAPNATSTGQPSINFTLPNGTTFQTFYVQALEGRVTDTVTATITVSATGFSNGTGTVNAIPPAIDLQGLPGTTTTLSPSNAVYVRAGTPNAANTALTQVQNVRFGGTPKVATFTTPSNGFGELLKAATAPGLTQTATIPANGTLYYTPTDTTSGGVAFHPLLAGGTTVSATIPDFISTTQATRSITVSQPGITVGSLTVGSGLQDNTSFSLGASNHGGVTVTVASSSTDVLVAPNATSAGQPSINFTLPNGTTFQSFYVQAVEGRVTDTVTATLTVSATGFSNGTGTVNAIPPAIDLQGLPGTTTTLSPSNAVYVRAGTPNAANTALTQVQNVRFGGTPKVATFTTPVGIGELLKAATGPGQTQTATIPASGTLYYTPTDTTSGGVAFHPLLGGTTTVSATIPDFIATAQATRSITVSQPGITVGSLTVGSGLQDATSFSLGAANHGGVTVTLTSSNAAMLLSTSSTAPGQGSISFNLNDGETFRSFYVQGNEGVSQLTATTVTVSASGFTDGTSTQTIVPVAIDLQGVPTTTTTLAAASAAYVRVGTANAQNTALTQVQNIRAGGVPLTATFTLVPANGVGELLKAGAAPSTTHQATIPVGLYYTPTDTTSGGVAFHPLIIGSTSVVASIPGVIATSQATRPITVSQPGITVGTLTVGSGLQEATSLSLAAPEHGGVTVTLNSANPQILLSPDATTPGQQQVSFNLADGTTFRSFYVQGVENVTQTATSAVTVTATGFGNGNAVMTIVQGALDLQGVPATVSSTAPVVGIYVRVGTPNVGNTALTQVQNIRAGGPGPLTATFNTSNVNAASMVTSTQTAGATSETAQITAGFYYTPTTVATGGVGLRPVAPGNASISAAITGFITTTAGVRPVQVQ